MNAVEPAKYTIRRARPHECRDVISLSLTSSALTAADLSAHVEGFLVHARAMKLDLSRQWHACDGERIVAGCTCVHSPGRMAMLMLSPEVERQAGRSGAVELIEAACTDAWKASNVLVQCIADPETGGAFGQLLMNRGFFRLARLRYLELQPLSKFPMLPGASAGIEWLSYNDAIHERFAAVVEQTYLKSHDCPALTHLRCVDDALAGHRGSGYFRPERWLLLRVNGRDAGCVLLTEVPLRGMLEVAYMGLIPESRGHGLGQCLLFKAVEVARVDGFTGLCLAVDTGNETALRLYERGGFVRIVEKEAWLRARSDAAEG